MRSLSKHPLVRGNSRLSNVDFHSIFIRLNRILTPKGPCFGGFGRSVADSYRSGLFRVIPISIRLIRQIIRDFRSAVRGVQKIMRGVRFVVRIGRLISCA